MNKERTFEFDYDGRKIAITGIYTPGEPEVRYYRDGSGYPGSSPEFHIEKITENGEDITDQFNDDELDWFMDKIIDKIENV